MKKRGFHLKPMDHIGSPATKQDFNRSMFSEVAPRYDFITKALSFGRDAAWKQKLIAGLPASEAPVCLDLASGTGDLTRMLADRYPQGTVTGLDLTPAMLERARKRTTSLSVNYIEGTMAALPFETGSADVVTGGYALRNAPHLNQTLDEIYRVLRPGGVAAFLDFSKPRNGIGQWLSGFLLKFWGGLWGLLLHGNPDVYGYLADSLKLYPDRIELRARFSGRGFILLQSRCFFGGLVEIAVFQKKPQSA